MTMPVDHRRLAAGPPPLAVESYVPALGWDLARTLEDIRAAIAGMKDPVDLIVLFNALHPLSQELSTLTYSCVAKAIHTTNAKRGR